MSWTPITPMSRWINWLHRVSGAGVRGGGKCPSSKRPVMMTRLPWRRLAGAVSVYICVCGHWTVCWRSLIESAAESSVHSTYSLHYQRATLTRPRQTDFRIINRYQPQEQWRIWGPSCLPSSPLKSSEKNINWKIVTFAIESHVQMTEINESQHLSLGVT